MKHAAILSPLVVACLALAGCVKAPAVSVTPMDVPYKPDSGSLAIQCGTLIDGKSATAVAERTIVIRDGRIAEVVAGYPGQGSLPVLDLRQSTCLPGLIDMHTHITESPDDTDDLTVYFRRTLEEQDVLSRELAADTLRAGFTTVRNVGVYHAFRDVRLRDQINKGQVAGPRMQAAGYYLTIRGGGGDLLPPEVPESQVPDFVRQGLARGPEQFRAKTQAAIDGGADVVKVIASGAVLAFGSEPGEPEMTPEELKVVVEVAHGAGRKVAAHAHGARSIKEAILAGADTIEHASLIDDEGIELAKSHGVALAMDVYNGDYIDTEGRRLGWPEEFLRKNAETTEAQRQGFTKAHAAGATIVYATDAGVFPHGLNARQFPIMVERGMSAMETIQAATTLAAKAMGWEDRVGAIEPGRLGDVIAVNGNPLEDVKQLQDVQVVVKGGLVFKKP